ncbi:uncharacterized protein LOC125815587 isoform X2 [Solanum verrucosum]|uniref:uncharacterized protein LOC125815587 isoform X2 n=1 Tax=Solanum verrucosum TaxID=315347 RepID=UPI0020D108E3|nr:uncharacterized protein LOC125815587 isoform X2 [Solanum verrucosum]
MHKEHSLSERHFLHRCTADSLEHYIMLVIVSTCADGASDTYCRKLNLFKEALKLLGWDICPSRSCSRSLKQLGSTCSLENLVGVNYWL